MNDTRKKHSIKNIQNIKFKTLLNSNLLKKSFSPNMEIFTQKNRSFLSIN